LALVGLLTEGTSRAVVNGSPSNFESNDGNMTVQTTGNTDWNCFANGNSSGFASNITVSTGGQTCATGLNFGDAAARPADQNGEIQLVNGSKFDDQCPGLNVGNNPPKDEFKATAEFSDVNASLDTFFYGASIRPTTNGNSSGNLELDQIAGNGTTQHGCRSSGDRLIAYDFLNGGTSLSFHVLTWIASLSDTSGGNNTGGVSGCFVKSDSPPCWGAKIITPDSTEFEGAVNTTSSIPANQNGITGAAINAFAFNEMGVNLTQVLGLTGKCFSFPQQVWESRSSGSSFTSNPQDLEFQSININNCGEIVIQKHTDPRGQNQAFGFTSDIAGSQLSAGTASGVTGAACAEAAAGFNGSYTLNDNGNTTADSVGNTNDCANVPQGTYHVTEKPDPGGYTFESLSCTADSTSGSSVSKSGQTATITLKPLGVVTCVYTNQLNTATMKTQVSNAGPVFPGVAVHDTATVTGNQTADTPSGTVTFSLCGPTQTDVGCSTGGTAAGSGTLSGTGAVASASSVDVNTSSNPLSPGHYCFRASWPGDANYPAPLTEFGGATGANECFTVKVIPTTTQTSPSVGSGGTTSFGSQVTDHALVTATEPDGGPLTGTVTFTVCNPTDLTNANETSCVTGGSQVGSPVQTTDLGTNPATATADSSAVTVNQTGTWCFRAVYTPSGTAANNYVGSGDATTDECFTVNDTTASTSGQTWVPNDTATVTSAHSAPLNGTLSAQLFNDGSCGNSGGTAVTGQLYSTTLSGAASPATLTTSNKTFAVSASTSVSWLVTFASSDPNVASSSHCESTSLNITN
jgi:hypothetical protein